MSPAVLSIHGRWRVDRAISHACARLAAEPRTLSCFTELLHSVRARGRRILGAPWLNERHLGIEACVQLARWSSAFLRSPSSWRGSQRSWRAVVCSLAQHLLARYPIPPFLAAAWYAAEDDFAEAKRRWFVAHGAGAPFRSLDLPIAMTRRMEHLFLLSRDHLGIEHALRRAELLGLGADARLTDAVLAARPALDLHHGPFWRTVWQLFVASARAIPIEQIGPLLDFLHAVRHERVVVHTLDGILMREPPQPQFSVRGRTIRSLLRLMGDWHRRLGLTEDRGLTWEPSHLRPLTLELASEDPSTPPATWELTELTSSAELRAESAALQHCVASYAHACREGRSRIWSIRRRSEGGVRSILTVEVDPRARAIVQARGLRNRPASGRALRFLMAWAGRERLRVTL